jgi:tetratricopeptide (TPR) repeat protein
LALLLLLLTPVPAAAQQASEDSMSRQFRLANAFMRSGQYERAIALLEDLHRKNPGRYVFYDKLKTAYENVKRYDDAIALVEEQMDERPSPSLLAEKARLRYLKGEEEAAFETWDRAIARAPERASTYRTVYQALVDLRRFERAIDVLERGREAIGRNDAFRLEVAYLYSLTGRHEAAMQEYVTLLADNPERQRFVRDRLSSFVDRDGMTSASIEVLNSAVQDQPLNRAYRELLAWLYTEEARYGKAFDAYRAIDRLEDEEGRVLFSFAQRAAEADAYEIATKAYRKILEQHPDAPIAPRAQRGLGDLERRWAAHVDEQAFDSTGQRAAAPHYQAAIDAYQTYLDQYPGHAERPDVLRQIGQLQLSVFRRLDAAEQAYRRVVDQHPGSEAASRARLALGRIALQRGDLQQARLAFSRLLDRLRTGDRAEQARYELARLHFYEGSFDAALSQLEAVNQNTSTEVANDAIDLKVLIRANQGPDSLNTPLRQYAQLRLLRRQQKLNQALAQADSMLQQYGRHALADETRFLRATVLERQRRAEAAATAFTEVAMMHRQSPLADRGLFRAAQLYDTTLRDTAQATKLYNRLLERYPNSLLASEVRTRIRELRTES